MNLREQPDGGKISPEFSARLSRLKPERKLHAIVLLRTPERSQLAKTRPTLEQRRLLADTIRSKSTDSLQEIDAILHRFGGRRLSQVPSALGTIAVESNSAGIAALANSNAVKAILEDQPISQAL